MEVKILKKIDVESERDLKLKLSDIFSIDSILSDLLAKDPKNKFESEYVSVDISGGRGIRVGNAIIETPLTHFFDLLVSHAYYSKIYGKIPQYKTLITDVRSKLDSVATTPLSGWFKVTGYFSSDDNRVSVGINGSRLLILAPTVSVRSIDAMKFYNPFNLDLSEVSDTLSIFDFNRYIKEDVNEFVEGTLISRPINALALSTYVEAFVSAHTEIDLPTVLTATGTLYGLLYNYDKHNTVEKLERETIDNIPRSFEGYARWFGYEGDIPLIDTPYCSYNHKGSVREISHLEYALLVEENVINNGKLHIDGSEILISLLPKAVGTKCTGITKIRPMVRFITALYLQDNFKKGESINLDLNDLFKTYDRNKTPLFENLVAGWKDA